VRVARDLWYLIDVAHPEVCWLPADGNAKEHHLQKNRKKLLVNYKPNSFFRLSKAAV
jgi:hypothetical protein